MREHPWVTAFTGLTSYDDFTIRDDPSGAAPPRSTPFTRNGSPAGHGKGRPWHKNGRPSRRGPHPLALTALVLYPSARSTARPPERSAAAGHDAVTVRDSPGSSHT